MDLNAGTPFLFFDDSADCRDRGSIRRRDVFFGTVAEDVQSRKPCLRIAGERFQRATRVRGTLVHKEGNGGERGHGNYRFR